MANLISIEVIPDPNSIPKGAEMPYTATGYYDDSSYQDITAIVTWSSNDEGIATVAPEGVVHGVDIGSTEITAIYGLITSNKAVIEVTAAVLLSWEINPDISAVPIGNTEQIVVKKVYTDGTKVDATITSCTSDHEDVATVTNTALVTAVAAGITYININTLDDNSNPVLVRSIILVQPQTSEQMTTKNYITNGQFDVYNDYIVPDNNTYDISNSTIENPFYITGSVNQDSLTNIVPNFGKIMFYKTGTNINGTDYAVLQNILTNDVEVGTAQRAFIHYCADYNVVGQTPSTRTYEYACASITEFDDEQVRVKATFANIGTTMVTVGISYRQYYSDIDDYYVGAPITIELLPPVDPNVPEIMHFDDVIDIQAVDHEKITNSSFFSLIFTVSTDGDEFFFAQTGIKLQNTIKKENATVDELNSFNKSNKLPELKYLDVINDSNKVLKTYINSFPLANGSVYNYLDQKYDDVIKVGTVIPHDGGDGVNQDLVSEGWLYAWGTLVSRTRFPRLCSYYNYKYLDSTESIVPYINNNIVNLHMIGNPLVVPSFSSGLTNLYIEEAGTETQWDTYVTCPSGSSLYSDTMNGGGYVCLYTVTSAWYFVFVFNNRIILPYGAPFNINNHNIVLVNIDYSMTSTQVAQAFYDACNPIFFKILTMYGSVPRGVDYSGLIDPNVSSRTLNGVVVGAVPGSVQKPAMLQHNHSLSSISVDLSNVSVKTTASSGGMMGPVIDETASGYFSYKTGYISGSASGTGTIGNSGTSTETRGYNTGFNFKIKY